MKYFKKTEFIVLLGLVLVPAISFIFIMTSPESPLYTSISRIAWVHDRWLATFVWAIIVMGTILLLTYKLIKIGPMSERGKRIFFLIQVVNICLVFIGCLLFPAKSDPEAVRFVHYMHDYLRADCLFYNHWTKKQIPWIHGLHDYGICGMVIALLSKAGYRPHVIRGCIGCQRGLYYQQPAHIPCGDVRSGRKGCPKGITTQQRVACQCRQLVV